MDTMQFCGVKQSSTKAANNWFLKITMAKTKTVTIAYLILTGIGFMLAGMLIGWAVFGSRPSVVPENGAYELFRKAYIRAETETFEDRIEAAGRLPRQRNSEPWVVLLLLDRAEDTYRLAKPDVEVDPETEGELDKFHNGVVAEVLMNVPDKPHKAVLWAVTAKLSDEGRGYRKDGGETRPIKDVARETLRRCLGVDHGYDAFVWRQAILNK